MFPALPARNQPRVVDANNLRVHSFLFGTRLTHITRQLAARDPTSPCVQ